MRRLFTGSRTSLVTLSVIALVIAAAGGAYAASGGGTITACVHKHGGTLYKAKKCSKGDAKISWNKAGQRGSTGKNGTNGKNGNNGNNGNNGAVAAFTTAPLSATVNFTTAGLLTQKTILSLTLPAGDYAISANTTATLSANAVTNYDVNCSLVDGATNDLVAGGGTSESNGHGDVNLAMNIDVSETATSTVSIECYNATTTPAAGFNLFANSAAISAVQANSVSG
jgi:hypothetical protein